MQKHPMYTSDRQVIQHSVNKDAALINPTLFMKLINRISLSVVIFLVLIFLLLIPQLSQASNTGIPGYSGNPATNGGQTCVLCHNDGNIPSISISGPTVVTAGSSNTYTVSLTGGQANQGGVDISVDSGILSVGSNSGIRLDTGSGELVHSQPATGSNLAWTFSWQAPSSPGSATLFFTGVSSNNDGNLTGDNTASSTLMITVTSGVNQAPVPIVSAPITGFEGVAVTFDATGSTDSDGSITTYDWDFADNTTGSGSVVNHIFAIGSYRVSLTVVDDAGLEATVVHEINILPGNQGVPIAAIVGTDHGVVGVPLTMDSTGSIDADGVIDRFLWDFGDNSEFAEGATVTHTYNTIGNYILTLAATDNDGLTGAAATSVTIIEGTPPIANAGGPYSGEVGLVINFDAGASSDSDGTLVDYIWDFGDGSTINGVAVSHTYASTGNFTVTLQVIDNDGLTATASTTVDIAPASNTALGNALYDANCASCHGPAGTGGAFVAVTGASAAFIADKISSVGSMNSIVLTPAEIQAIADYLAGSTGGKPTDGQGLYNAYCSACHGVDGVGGPNGSVTGASVNKINNAISEKSVMQNLANLLNASEINLISAFLNGLPSGGGTGGGSGTTGQALYDTNCAACHGPGGTGGAFVAVTGASASLITSSISSIGAMNNINLSTTEIQSIADYLAGSTGGGTGGGAGTSTGQTLYDTNCAACHGPGGTGGAFVAVTGASASLITSSISSIGAMNNINLTTTEIQSIADYLAGSTGGGTGGGAGTSTGQTLYDTNCAACHGPGGTGGAFVAVTGASASLITSSISSIGAMNNINLSTTEIQSIADYLAGSTGGGGATKPTDGQGLYNVYCSVCHGANGVGGSEGSVRGASSNSINSAIREKTEMRYLDSVLTGQDVDLISGFLRSSSGEGD